MYSMTGILKEFLLESMQALIDTKTYGTFRIEKQEIVFKEIFWKTERERRWTKFLKNRESRSRNKAIKEYIEDNAPEEIKKFATRYKQKKITNNIQIQKTMHQVAAVAAAVAAVAVPSRKNHVLKK